MSYLFNPNKENIEKVNKRIFSPAYPPYEEYHNTLQLFLNKPEVKENLNNNNWDNLIRLWATYKYGLTFDVFAFLLLNINIKVVLSDNTYNEYIWNLIHPDNWKGVN